jgi:two-component system, sensor histidine kinase ChiS
MFITKNLKSNLISAFLLLSIIPIIALSILSLFFFSRNIEEQVLKQLVSVRDIKRTQIIDYFEGLKRQVLNFTDRDATRLSLNNFSFSFRQLGSTIEEARETAQMRFLTGSKHKTKLSDASVSQLSMYEFTQKLGPYGKSHRDYHPSYLSMVNKSDFNDIFLTDINGNIIYSVLKEKNFGTNLIEGQFSNTHLASAFVDLSAIVENQSIQAKSKDIPVYFKDFEIDQVTGKVVAYLATPIMQYGLITGALFFQLSAEKMNALMGERSGLGETGETYLVGEELRMRSNSFLDPENHSLMASFQNEQNGSADSQFIQNGFSNITGIATGISYLGSKVLSAYVPLNIFGVQWVLIAEISEKESNLGINRLSMVLLIMALLSIISLVFIAFILSSSILTPVTSLTKITGEIAKGNLNKEIEWVDREDELGSLAQSITNMRNSIREHIAMIEEKNIELGQKITVIEDQNLVLQEADKLKDEFLANTSHELRTPTNGIIGIAESMLDGATGELEIQQKNNLSMIVSSGKRLSNLVNDLLDFHKIRHNTLTIFPKRVHLRSVVNTVLELSEHLIGSKKIELLNLLPFDLPYVFVDEGRLEQILFNLIGNAIKYTEKGKIEIRTRVNKEEVCVQVIDTGIGIAEDQQQKIFKSLEQGDGSINREYGGAGLGLSISKQLVELQGGRIWVESTEKKGSTFFFSLLIAKNQQASPVGPIEVRQQVRPHVSIVTETSLHELTPPQVNYTPNSENYHTILIVDDDPINLQVLMNYLALAHYKLLCAKNGFEALDILKNETVDLVLLDVMMPKMSGYEVCQIIRETRNLVELPVVMLTARNQLDDLVEGFKSGANDYLVKPFFKDELYARVKTLLQAKASIDRRKENIILKNEIKRRNLAETKLEASYNLMARILESAEDAIICINQEKKVSFFNEGAQRIFGFSSEEALNQPLNIFFTQPFSKEYENYIQQTQKTGNHIQRKSCQLTAIHKKTHQFTADGFLSSFVINAEVTYAIILHHVFNNGEIEETGEDKGLVSHQISENQKKIVALENALEELNHFFKKESKSIEDFKGATINPVLNNQEDIRSVAVDVMTKAITCWENGTSETKIELCEKSKIWKVYIDRGTFQCRTLNKYLSIHTIPKNPRYLDVIKTAEYILSSCPADTPGKSQLEASVSVLLKNM